MMTKKDFIALAEFVIGHDFTPVQLEVLAAFCKNRNPRFDKEKWFKYIESRETKICCV